ncbi:hypothetical protein EDD18DRAFT_1328696 [Armillaria luteobubalina]|uniref:F-box domain-containing protein n=1 Tax=Armillaria luteobubalina TaxID=153913 RepID=A0AA39QHM1_9AGAR|nr:hypothetical protein EDD18DRAFT_1328696 [Armillaria luteobubalina]
MSTTKTFLNDLLDRYDYISSITCSPELSTLVTTNNAPLPFQTAQLKPLVADLSLTTTQLQNEIDLLKTATETLEKHASHLREITHDYETALSPIRHLPAEILIEIFRWTCVDCNAYNPYHLSGFNVFEINQGPWLLSHVCGSWRNIVTTVCSDLWSRFVLEIPDKTVNEEDDCGQDVLRVRPAMKYDMVALFEFYEEWERRDEDEDEENEDEVMSSCLDMLVCGSKRWRSAELVLPGNLLSDLCSVRGEVGKLEEVYLCCWQETPPLQNIDGFEIAPNLRTVHLRNMHPDAVIPFPIGNLVSFLDHRRFAEHKRPSEYLNTVASAPDLSSFSYHHYGRVPKSGSTNSSPVESKSLQALSASLGIFLSGLILPNLKSMTLSTGIISAKILYPRCYPCPRDALSALHGLITRSECSLTKLHLMDVKMDKNLLPIIKLSPKLESIVIEYRGRKWQDESEFTINSLFRHMSKTEPILVPFLKELVIISRGDNRNRIGCLGEDFVAMVISRRKPHLL